VPSGGASAPTHACVRCGAPVAIDVGLCEKCNPLGLRDSASSQVHGLAIGGIVLFVILMAVAAHFALAGVGPFEGAATAVPDGSGLSVTLTVTNRGSSTGSTTCHVTDPSDRTGSLGAFILSPRIAAGQTISFTQTVTELGSTVRPLTADCSAP
jgi:ribosomal protein L40E